MIVEQLTEKFEKRLSDFVLTIRNLLGDNLKSIILYGSAVRGEFDTKRSDLNFLVVLDQVDYSHLALLAPHIRRWSRKRISTPLVLSPQYISTALDVYPLEFLEMQSAKRVLFGEDVLADIQPPPLSVRRQCEQEARGKLLHLREILLETGLKPRYLKKAMILSVPSFMRIGRHVLQYLGKTGKVHAREVIEELRYTTQLSLRGLEAAWTLKTGERKASRAEIAGLFESYLNDTADMTKFVDTMQAQ